MNYINGLQVAGGNSTFPGYAHGARNMRRLMFLWLTKVIGFGNQETSGSNWDNPELSAITDGATDATNPRRFTSATGGFTSSMEGLHLLTYPTAAPATAGGFTDATRNGFYRIKRVYDSNTIDVEIFNGVHTDGLPLNETGVRFEVHDLNTNAKLPADNDYFVVRGTGAGGDYDVRFREFYGGGNYGHSRIQVSPWADWVAGAPGSFTPSTRLTAEAAMSFNLDAEACWIWAVGDLTQVTVWVRYFNETLSSANDSQFLYFGDIEPFQVSDTRAVVLNNSKLDSNLSELPFLDFKMVAADDTTQIDADAVFLTSGADETVPWHSDTFETRSEYSGNYARSPILLYTNSGGNEEYRGELKNIGHGHFNGPRGPIPMGASRDRIRFFTELNAPWNGSKIYRYVF